MTYFELQRSVASVGEELKEKEEMVGKLSADPAASMDDVRAVKKEAKDVKERFDILKEQFDAAEREQQAKLNQKQQHKNQSPEAKKTGAMAKLIRSTMNKEAVAPDVFEALGDDDTSKGGKFLPKTVSTELLSEPTTKNPLRDIEVVSQIPNLEIPKIAYSLDDDNFIADTETAKEIKATGDTVSFTRNKFKVFTGVSETVLQGTDTALVANVEANLQSGVAAKERKVAFAKAPKAGEEHMSFYSTETGIKKVDGGDMFEAIQNAIADLNEDYRDSATIVMAYADYMKIIKTLANGSATLYAAQPEQILGKPVVFIDAATTPIVGNFSFAQFNYDLASTFESDKDVKTGIESFVVTAWFDHRIKLASAFRLANVAVGK